VTDLDELLPAIAAGDAEAFGRWMAAAEPGLRRSLRGFAAQVDTEAVLQEGLLRVWQVTPRVTPDGKGNSLLRLAHRIVRNAALDEARRMGNRMEAPTEEVDPGAVSVSEPDPWLRELIAACFEALPPTPKKLLAMRLEAHGGVHDQVLARRAKKTLNTFLQAITRAKKLMGQCLERKGVSLEAP
jgi:RNA polymerase sigma-70 factor (ECF subfamily)